MIKWLFKYGFVLFLFNTIFLSIESTYFIGRVIFLSLMVIYSFAMLINFHVIKQVIFHKSFLFLLLINILNFIYFIFFHSIDDLDALQYLLARTIQFSIITISLYFNFNYYRNNFQSLLVFLIAMILVISFLYDINLFSGRYSGIIWNPNMLSSFVTVAFGFLFLSNNNFTIRQYILLFCFFLVALLTGSRSVIFAFGLIYLIKYGVSLKNILYSLSLFLIFFLLLNLKLETSINRIFSQEIFNDRLLQFEYAYQTFIQKPYFGYGLDKYSYIDLSLVPNFLKNSGYIISSHNGYLAILTQYGLIFGGIIILIFVIKTIELLNSVKYDSEDKVYIFCITYTLVYAVFETMITGINEFQTILFWFSLAFLSHKKNLKANGS